MSCEVGKYEIDRLKWYLIGEKRNEKLAGLNIREDQIEKEKVTVLKKKKEEECNHGGGGAERRDVLSTNLS